MGCGVGKDTWGRLYASARETLGQPSSEHNEPETATGNVNGDSEGPRPGKSGIAVKYAAVIEETGNGNSAYIPDLPGCVAAGDTRAATEALIREAVVYHLEWLREGGEPIPAPQASTSLVEVYGANVVQTRKLQSLL